MLFLFSLVVVRIAVLLCLSAILTVCDNLTELREVKILNLLVEQHPTWSVPKTVKVGKNAALWSYKRNVAEGVIMTEIYGDPLSTNISKEIDTYATKHKDLILILGPMTVKQLLDSEPTLKKHDLVAFAPFAGSSAVRYWTPYFYFVRAGPVSAVLALLRYAVTFLRVRRLGFIYLTGVWFGDTEYEVTVNTMLDMGYSMSNVFRISGNRNWSFEDPEFQREWEAFAGGRPQAIIVYCKPLPLLTTILSRVFHDKRTRDAYLLAPFGLEDIVVGAYKNAVTKGLVPFLPGHVITTGLSPLAHDIRYKAIRRFQKVMRAYLSTYEGRKEYSDANHFLNNPRDGELMVIGWMVGELLVRAMSSRAWLMSRAAFRRALFDQRRYMVDDIVVGDYGGECSDLAEEQGAICRCNQGGRTVMLKRIVSGFVAEVVPRWTFTQALGSCYPSAAAVRKLGHVLALLLSAPTAPSAGTAPHGPLLTQNRGNSVIQRNGGSAVNAHVSVEAVRGARAALSYPSQHEFTLRTLAVDDGGASAADALRREMDVRYAEFALGFATRQALDAADPLFFVDPITSTASANRFSRQVLHLSPTAEQQLHVLARYVCADPKVVLHAELHGDDALSLREPLNAALRAQGCALSDVASEKSVTFVFGLGDAAQLHQQLTANKNKRVAVLFNELVTRWENFCSAFGGGGNAAHRVLFATSIPHWADTQNKTPLLASFHKAVKEEAQRTPIALATFAAGRALIAAAERIHMPRAEQLANHIYHAGILTAEDMTYGPFNDGALSTPNDKNVQKTNFGATNIAVWSLARALDPSIPPLTSPITPDMNANQSALLSTGLLILIISLSIGIAFTFLLIGVLCICFCFRSHRDCKNAPKDLEHPVTLIFTDIQRSTALWAACPQIMPDAVDTHHRLIRRLIAKHRCYEVKTVGDSFMIACKNPYAAVQLVGDLQRTFLEHDWGTSAIDEAYREFEERQAEADADYEPPTARLDAAVYRAHWRGLRVRAGVHTGLSDIRHDEVTKGYDYYGSASNTAARTESIAHGGQVLLTRAAFMALSAAERAGLDVTALGAVELRGVPEPVEMLQLNAVPGRAFAALRLERGNDEFDFLEDSISVDGRNRSVSSLRSSEAALVDFINRVFAPIDPTRRVEMLRNLCKGWGVRPPLNVTKASLNDYSQVIGRELALKISCIVGPEAFRNVGLYEDERLLGSSVRGESAAGAVPLLVEEHSSEIRV